MKETVKRKVSETALDLDTINTEVGGKHADYSLLLCAVFFKYAFSSITSKI